MRPSPRSTPDLGVVAAYGKILSEEVLATPRLGMINVHASLLPRYRGAAPVHRAVIAGEPKPASRSCGSCKALDAGPMLATVRRPIGRNETSEDVELDLARLGATLLVTTLDRISAGPVEETPQVDADATYASRLTKDDGAIDWSQPATQIHNQIRGLHPWPHAPPSTAGASSSFVRHHCPDRPRWSLEPSWRRPVTPVAGPGRGPRCPSSTTSRRQAADGHARVSDRAPPFRPGRPLHPRGHDRARAGRGLRHPVRGLGPAVPISHRHRFYAARAAHDDRDRALASEIATGVQRWRGARPSSRTFAKRAARSLDPEIVEILRLSAYQLLHLTRVPASAVVDDAVNLTKKAGKTSASGLD